MLIPSTWANVTACTTVLARDGRPRLIVQADPFPMAPSPNYPTLISVVTANGERQVIDDRQPALIIAATHNEAVLSILSAFPGSSIVSDRHA